MADDSGARELEGARDVINRVLNLRNRYFFLLDVLTLLWVPALALALRLDGLGRTSEYGPALLVFTLAGLAIKLSVFQRLGLYRRYWRYAGVNDLARVVAAASLSSMLLVLLFLELRNHLLPYGLAVPRSVPIIDGLLTGMVVAGYRFAVRGVYHWRRREQNLHGGGRVLVVGAGEAGILAVHEMRSNPQLGMQPVAFADDDPAKIGSFVQGLPVLGPIRRLPELAAGGGFERAVLAMPSAPLGRQREITELCRATGLTMQDLPGVYEILAGHKTVSRLGRVDVSQLLRREPVSADAGEVERLLQGEVVLVTGAGGSIGSELCRQVARCRPRELILLGHGENSIFEIQLDLRLSHPNLATRPAIADVRDARRLQYVIERCRPRVIFHAAAHKHVPLMEANVEEAITTNVLGTRNVLRAAGACGVERLVLISSDKAVNPTSVMGATKRLAEMLTVAAAGRSGRAYMAVRFGNVLGSRGSVVPIFQRQIAAGGPLTITHPDMCRYFMTIPEAVQLVLQAAVLGTGAEVFVLDMGQPVRILDLAQELIRLSGLKLGRDIQVVFSGVRPGEKLSEELFLTRENYRRTRHSQVFAAASESPLPPEVVDGLVDELVALAERLRGRDALHDLGALLPRICRAIDQVRPEPLPFIPSVAPASAPAASPSLAAGQVTYTGLAHPVG